MIEVLRSKIHRATATETELNYNGSISLPDKLMNCAGIYEFQKVLVVDVNNGQRFETYAIKSDNNTICINGAAARLVNKGDKIIVMSFQIIDELDIQKYKPNIVFVDDENNII